MVRGAKAAGLPVTAEATTHHFISHRRRLRLATTRYSRSIRRLRTDVDVEGDPRRVSPTERSTRSPRTTRRTPRHTLRRRPFDQAPAGDARPRDRSVSLALERFRTGPPRGAGRSSPGARRPSPVVADRHGVPVGTGQPPSEPLRGGPRRDLDGLGCGPWRVLSSNTPYEGRTPAGSRPPHHERAGEPVVVDGEARR